MFEFNNLIMVELIVFVILKNRPKIKPLKGKKICKFGKLSKNNAEIKSMVERMGGKICTQPSSANYCISSEGN